MRSVKNTLTDVVFRPTSGKYSGALDFQQGERCLQQRLCSAEAEHRKETGLKSCLRI